MDRKNVHLVNQRKRHEKRAVVNTLMPTFDLHTLGTLHTELRSLERPGTGMQGMRNAGLTRTTHTHNARAEVRVSYTAC